MKTVLLSLVTCLALAGITTTPVNTAVAAPEPPTPEITTIVQDVLADSPLTPCIPAQNYIELERTAGLDYMRGSERVKRYQQVWPAAKKVARGLLYGKFGVVKKYDDDKQPLKSNYTGWGGVESADGLHYAWVYWEKGRRANLNRGVLGFSIDGLQIESVDSGDGPFRANLERGVDTVKVVDTTYLGMTQPASGPYIYPLTRIQLEAFDAEVLGALRSKLKVADL